MQFERLPDIFQGSIDGISLRDNRQIDALCNKALLLTGEDSDLDRPQHLSPPCKTSTKVQRNQAAYHGLKALWRVCLSLVGTGAGSRSALTAENLVRAAKDRLTHAHLVESMPGPLTLSEGSFQGTVRNSSRTRWSRTRAGSVLSTKKAEAASMTFFPSSSQLSAVVRILSLRLSATHPPSCT